MKNMNFILVCERESIKKREEGRAWGQRLDGKKYEKLIP